MQTILFNPMADLDDLQANFTVLKIDASCYIFFSWQATGDSYHPEEIEGWPLEEYDLGQISGVDIDKSGNPIVFHRGTVIWDAG